MKGSAQNRSVLSFLALFFILALISAFHPVENDIPGKNSPFGQPAVAISPFSDINLSPFLIRAAAPLETPLNLPDGRPSAEQTRAPPA
jgi:hypothetical protein